MVAAAPLIVKTALIMAAAAAILWLISKIAELFGIDWDALKVAWEKLGNVWDWIKDKAGGVIGFLKDQVTSLIELFNKIPGINIPTPGKSNDSGGPSIDELYENQIQEIQRRR